MKQENSLVLEFFFALKTRCCWNDPISFTVSVQYICLCDPMQQAETR